MNRLLSLAFCIGLFGIAPLFAQSNTAPTPESMRSAYESRGIHFDQVQSMIQMVTETDAVPAPAMLQDFLRTIETFQAEGAPVPMTDEWLNKWVNTYNVSSEQAQDLYKVALRFALQPRRE